MCVCLVPLEDRSVSDPLEPTGATVSCELPLPAGCWEPNQGRQEEQLALLPRAISAAPQSLFENLQCGHVLSKRLEHRGVTLEGRGMSGDHTGASSPGMLVGLVTACSSRWRVQRLVTHVCLRSGCPRQPQLSGLAPLASWLWLAGPHIHIRAFSLASK